MTPLSPALSWAMLALLALAAIACARAAARWLEARDEWRDIEEWRRMCQALDLNDLDPPDDRAFIDAQWDYLEERRRELERPYDWEGDA